MLSYDTLLQFGTEDCNGLHIKNSFSVTCNPKKGRGSMVIEALACYTGEEEPRIQFALKVNGQEGFLYQSHSYCIGKKEEYTRKSWRVPPLFLPQLTLVINIEIPNGTILNIKSFGMGQDTGKADWNGGYRHNAHLGFWGLAPDNTMPAFELAEASGFSSCIVVPKVTKDGILVCIHDDTINRTARDKDGNAPEEPIYVWDKTYDELLEWEYGSYKNEVYKGTKMPLLSDFFDLCAKTGMRPMFSTHPGLTVEQWQQVKNMLEERGLLKNFHIKSFGLSILETAYSVFGTEIEGYTYDVGKWENSPVSRLLNSGIDSKSCRVGVEFVFDQYTREIATEIRDAGFFAAAWNIKRCNFSEYQRLFSLGVTEFTEDYHCSMGLNY